MLDAVPAKTPSPLREVGPRARLRATLFALLAFDASTTWASTEPASELAVQLVFDAPSAPGDSFTLAFPVPAGHLAAVLFADAPSDPGAQVGIAPSTDDFAHGLLLPVPVAPGMPTAILTGVVPETVDAQQLLSATIHLRVLLVDATTMDVWWSEPIALTAQNEAPELAADETAAIDAVVGATKPSGSMQAQTVSATQLAMTASQSTATPTASNSMPSVQSGTPSGNSNSKKSNGPMSVVMRQTGSAFTYDGSHDQPVPVQGSGH
ncbi:MAG: hypothetical protein IPH13_05370 [Planctomycetes bacterium]|nr:hypothetical protein [Planctomycetota bacterium]